MEVYGEQLQPGEPVVYWTHRDQHRFVVSLDWESTKDLFERVLRRFRGGRAQYQHAQRELLRLAKPGGTVPVWLREHAVGLVRPYVLSQLGEPEEPVMICRNARDPRIPVLFASVEEARDFARRLRDRGVPARDWIRFWGERELNPTEKLFAQVTGDALALRTELEAELAVVLGGRRHPGVLSRVA